MSEQGFRGVPGVPEGWELVEVRPISEDWTIGSDGKPMFYEGGLTTTWWPVIRKIEKPKKYRPFESAEEFEPHRNRWVQVVKEDNMSSCDLEEHAGGPAKIVAYNGDSVCVYGGWITYDEAFECFVFDGGTPFGIEVTE